jgi:hypothetical protein
VLEDIRWPSEIEALRVLIDQVSNEQANRPTQAHGLDFPSHRSRNAQETTVTEK